MKIHGSWIPTLCFLATFVALEAYIYFSEPVLAAQPAPPEIKPCQTVNTFGTIEIARCEPENGLPYYVNNMGFMLAGEP